MINLQDNFHGFVNINEDTNSKLYVIKNIKELSGIITDDKINLFTKLIIEEKIFYLVPSHNFTISAFVLLC